MRQPNPSIERKSDSKLRLLLSAAHVKRKGEFIAAVTRRALAEGYPREGSMPQLRDNDTERG
jgi:hypothetical protein